MADLSVESRHQLSTALDTDFEAFGYSRFLRPANVTRIGSAPSRGPQRSGPTRSGVGPDATFTDAEVIEKLGKIPGVSMVETQSTVMRDRTR